MKTKTYKRRNYRRKTYKGGILEANKTNCNKEPSEEFKRLYDAVDTKKYSRGFTTYSGGGCDLFIWVKKAKDPHIHVHGFTNKRFFSYTISGLDIRNEEVELLSRTEEGYKYVLDKMCSGLTKGKHTPTSKLFNSPKKGISILESPRVHNKSITTRSGIGSDIYKDVSVQLGPIMGSVRDK